MPLDAEFKKHLHSLMVEMAEKTQDEWVRHKNELIGKAIATHNSAAPPIAYKDAELYRMELRLSKTIEKYIEAVSIWGYSIDAAFERDMTNEFWGLTAGPNQVPFPPAIRGQHAQAVQRSYARERAQLANRLVREGTNRLRELKIKKRQANQTANNITTVTILANTSPQHPNPTVKSSNTEEVVMLSPNFYGIGVNLRSLWRRMKRSKE